MHQAIAKCLIRGLSRSLLLSAGVRYQFVNFPISSKYYHQQMPIYVGPSIQLVKKEQKLNEKCYLIEHMVELIQKDPKLHINQAHQQFIISQLKLWKGGSGRFQRIATVAWTIKKLKLESKLKDLYDEIMHRIDSDQWYVNFEESVKAMEAFVDYPDEGLRERVYQKIQRNVGITISDVNMKYYQRISQSLFLAGRNSSDLWDKIENHVIRNLGMDYSLKTFLQIFKAFALSRNGTEQFYEICQHVLYKSHLDDKTYRLRSNLTEFDSTGEYFALLVETYAMVLKNSSIQISSQFLDYLFKSLKHSKVEFRSISSLTRILQCIPHIGFEPEEQKLIVGDIIKNKNFTNFNSLSEIQHLYANLEVFYGQIPLKIQQNVQRLVLFEVGRKSIPLIQAVKLAEFLLIRNQTDSKELLLKETQKYMNNQFQYLEKEDAKELMEHLSQQDLLPAESKRLMLPSFRKT